MDLCVVMAIKLQNGSCRKFNYDFVHDYSHCLVSVITCMRASSPHSYESEKMK